MSICISISFGEFFDKYSILLIKQKQLKEETKLNIVNKELYNLKDIINKYNIDKELFNELYNINQTLWDIENNIRMKEYNKQFDDEFINLARSVYINNDKRSSIKNKINNYFNSELIEIKDYFEYN